MELQDGKQRFMQAHIQICHFFVIENLKCQSCRVAAGPFLLPNNTGTLIVFSYCKLKASNGDGNSPVPSCQ